MNIEEKKADKEAESFCVLQCLAIKQVYVDKYNIPHSIDDKCGAILQWGTKYNFFQKIGGFMEILNKEFWEKRDAAMKRFMASKERKRKRMAELEQMLRQDYLARTGEEPKFVNVW